MTLSLVLAATLLGYALPRLVGTTVPDVLGALRIVAGSEAVLLTLLWLAGLYVYSFVLTAALPGLTHQRALNLNLTGSAVANVLPFGGAAGMSLNYVMIRSWGFDVAGFSAYTLITNLWAILLKLAMPAVALVALVVSGQHVAASLRWSGLVAAGLLTGVVVTLLSGLVRRRAAASIIALLAPLVAAVSRLVRRPLEQEMIATELLAFRDRVSGLVGARWGQLTLATAGYGLLQAALLWACLHAVGAHLGLVMVLAGYAVDRVMSIVFLTPGAAGFAEAGMAGVLVAMGGAPAVVTAGVLLYRGFTFALEIPVGGAWLAGWLLLRRRRLQAEKDALVPVPVGE